MRYPSGRTWANICCLSGYAYLVKRQAQDALCLDILPFKILFERRTTKYNSSRRVTCLEYKNGQCPMFEMSIIRSQHLHKAFFLSPTSQTSQPAFVLGIKVLLPFLALPASSITANAVLPSSAISTTPLAPVPVLHQPFMVGPGFSPVPES